MYIRTKQFINKNGSTRTYLQIVENRRVNGKPTQKVIANLGRTEELKEKEIVDRLIEGLARFSQHQWIQAQAEELSTEWGKEWGSTLVYRWL